MSSQATYPPVGGDFTGSVIVTNFPANQAVTVTNASLAVTGTFFPATQPVSGTVAISNFPATQNVNVTNLSLAVTGTFFQATQPVSVSNFPSTQNVNVTNASLAVTGTFFPATQPVSGTFFQATQPISAVALPLPSGASTSALQTTGNTSLASIDTKLPTGLITVNSGLLTTDTANTTLQSRAQSITTSQSELLGAATILANRKVLTFTPTNGTIFWGATGVTTATGTPVLQGISCSLSVGANVHIFAISAGTIDTRVAEAS